MLRIPNIYNYKNLKVLVLIPIVLMLLGIYFSTRIILDTSLKGGVSIILQTNTTTSTSVLAGEISSRLHSEAPDISRSPGGLQITLGINQSIADAETYLTAFYAHKSNYSARFLNVTALSLALQRDSGNATLAGELRQASASANTSIAGMQDSLRNELNALKPLGISYAINSSDISQMQAVAQGAYANASNRYKESTISALHSVLEFSSYSYEQVTPTLGRFFLQQIRDTIIIAFVLVFIIVLVIFRSPVPSAVVVFGAANDIVVALGAMGLLGIPLGVASIAGLLMLIGYSMDTDILTAIRILRRGEGRPEDRAYSSMRTGVTMTATAVVSFAVLFIISVIEYVPTYYQISSVVLVGLVGDVITTWFGNAALILMYKKRKDKL